jgi:outer membrane immunogenic protein
MMQRQQRDQSLNVRAVGCSRFPAIRDREASYVGAFRNKDSHSFLLIRGIGMRRFVFAGIGLLSIGGLMQGASAADLPADRSPAMAAPIYHWGGFYVGANGGWGSSHDSRLNLSDGRDLGSYDATGGVAGGQLGYRWQAGGWVFGLEAQGDWADLSGSTPNAFVAGEAIRSRMDAFGLFTGQVGYAFDNVLLYAKGGAALTDRNYQFLDTAAAALVSSSGYQTRWSGTVGAGLEYGFTPNWSFALEYDHIFEDQHTVGFVTPAGRPSAATFASGGDTDMITVRVNYHFGNSAIPYN